MCKELHIILKSQNDVKNSNQVGEFTVLDLKTYEAATIKPVGHSTSPGMKQRI